MSLLRTVVKSEIFLAERTLNQKPQKCDQIHRTFTKTIQKLDKGPSLISINSWGFLKPNRIPIPCKGLKLIYEALK